MVVCLLFKQTKINHHKRLANASAIPIMRPTDTGCSASYWPSPNQQTPRVWANKNF